MTAVFSNMLAIEVIQHPKKTHVDQSYACMLGSVIYPCHHWLAIMLHAFTRNKSRAYKKYLGEKDPSEPRVCSEDEITSIVFGPLDFLSPADHWSFWKALLQGHASMHASGRMPPDFMEGFAPVECLLDFWPRKNRIEPDIVIEFTDAVGESRSLVVELKWNAGVSGDDQLQKQWLDYQEGLHAQSLHVFIAKQMSELPSDRNAWSVSGANSMCSSRLRSVRWHDLRHEIAKLAASPTVSAGLIRWCKLTDAFLSLVGIRAFAGFHASRHLAESNELRDDTQIVFWSPYTTRPGTSPFKETP